MGWRYAEKVGSPPKHTSRRLVVEGHDDRMSVLGLARHRLQWPDPGPVLIDLGGGAEEILESAYLTTLLKTRELKIAGIMFDADSSPEKRYRAICKVCSEFFPNLPGNMPTTGLIVQNAEGKRFGVWIMPDNSSKGDLELFLRYLIPEASEPVWKYAEECVENAKRAGAPYTDSQVRKANLYTWLAWQEPPGQSPGTAITKKILDPNANMATDFINWFRDLYELQNTRQEDGINEIPANPERTD
ncbi:MAG: DUF3226 domain-containing protein [Terriglobia bacterium]